MLLSPHSVVYLFFFDNLVKSYAIDDTVKSSRCQARESLGMRRTEAYVGMTEDEAQRSRWTFYEVVFFVSEEISLTASSLVVILPSLSASSIKVISSPILFPGLSARISMISFPVSND